MRIRPPTTQQSARKNAKRPGGDLRWIDAACTGCPLRLLSSLRRSRVGPPNAPRPKYPAGRAAHGRLPSAVPWQPLLQDGLDARLSSRKFGDLGAVGGDLFPELVADGSDLGAKFLLDRPDLGAKFFLDGPGLRGQLAYGGDSEHKRAADRPLEHGDLADAIGSQAFRMGFEPLLEPVDLFRREAVPCRFCRVRQDLYSAWPTHQTCAFALSQGRTALGQLGALPSP